jgi:hypothetical protein
MNTKQYLNQVRRYDRMISNKLSEIYQLKTLATSISVATDSDRVQSSGNKDRMGNTVARLVDLERETDKLIQVYTEKRQVIISQIDSMEDMNFYDVLFHRYIEGKTFEAISEDIHYSWRQVMRIHDDALAAFEKKFGSCYMS